MRSHISDSEQHIHPAAERPSSSRRDRPRGDSQPRPRSEAEIQKGIERIGVALHDLCQPATTLQCRLEIAEMMNTPEDYREAVLYGLSECSRLFASVAIMREALREMMPGGE